MAVNHYGQEHGWLRFREKDGLFEPDFSVVDRYMDLYERYVGKPEYLMVHVWDPWVYRHVKRGENRDSIPVSVLDEQGGVRHAYVFPPAAGDAASDALWRSVMAGLLR